jgi:hypothetical protein
MQDNFRFLNTIKILHTEVLWQMLLMIRESIEVLEKHILTYEKSKDYKNYYKSFEYLNRCRWKVLEVSKEIEGRVLK